MGCGWLGLPLAKKLIEEGYTVSGTTTTDKKKPVLHSEGIEAYAVTLFENKIIGDIDPFLSDLDILVINIPPALRKGPKTDYTQKMQLLNAHIKKTALQHILFVSSTSVYGNQEGKVTEATTPLPNTESGRQLLVSEQIFTKQDHPKATILRFGGLIGPNRHPINQLSGKIGLKNGEELINLIHLDDCIKIITMILKKGYWGEIFNGVYPYHPTKREYYLKEAQKRNLNPPLYVYSDSKKGKKTIISKNLSAKNHVLHTSIVS